MQPPIRMIRPEWQETQSGRGRRDFFERFTGRRVLSAKPSQARLRLGRLPGHLVTPCMTASSPRLRAPVGPPAPIQQHRDAVLLLCVRRSRCTVNLANRFHHSKRCMSWYSPITSSQPPDELPLSNSRASTLRTSAEGELWKEASSALQEAYSQRYLPIPKSSTATSQVTRRFSSLRKQTMDSLVLIQGAIPTAEGRKGIEAV